MFSATPPQPADASGNATIRQRLVGFTMKSSATAATRRADCNRDAMPPFPGAWLADSTRTAVDVCTTSATVVGSSNTSAVGRSLRIKQSISEFLFIIRVSVVKSLGLKNENWTGNRLNVPTLLSRKRDKIRLRNFEIGDHSAADISIQVNADV